jgi:hypothetical protein
MNLRALSRPQRLILLALVLADFALLCLLGSAVGLSLRRINAMRPAPGPAVADLPATPTGTATAPPTPTTTPTPQPTNTRVVSREFYNQPIVDDVMEAVVSIRQLPPLAEVPFKMLDREQVADEMVSLYGIDTLTQDLERQWALYRALGLIPADAVLEERDVQQVLGQYAGLYVPERERIYLITERANMSAEEEVVFAHEYTHALQDQNFDLQTYLADVSSTDANLAARALVEGDATMVMALYTYGNTTQAEWEYLAYRASFAERPELELDALSERAAAIVGFPYQEGTAFVLSLFLTEGWRAVNAAFAQPPRSTEQILHPERYAGQPDLPQDVGLNADPGASWALILEDTLGEYVLIQHLDQFLEDPERAATAADGWDGDRIAVWQDEAGQPLVLWSLVWDDEAEAEEFALAYGELIEERFAAVQSVGEVWWQNATTSIGFVRQGAWVHIVWGPRGDAPRALLDQESAR